MIMPEALPAQTLRIIDASLNRAAEGLRYLEDVSRFLLNDFNLTQRLKSIRHDLVVSDWQFQKQLLESRDASGDVGTGIDAPEKGAPRDLPSSIVANSRRVQEALRTLEELAKVSDIFPKMNSDGFQQARFELYTLEKDLLGKLLRKETVNRIHGLYVIIDTQALKGRSHVEVVTQVIRGGARIIQLRDKTMERGELYPIARALRDLCARNDVLFIMNDYLDLALAVQADGLHIGQQDLPVKLIRKMMPMGMILGCSANTADLAVEAQADGADYIGVGAIYPTSSKQTAKVVGLETLRQVKKTVSLPLVAIGGITAEKLNELKAAGADSVAVISAVLGADSPENATRELIAQFEVENG
jgi:thiamine-phosphate pyrophosphorylase